MIVISVVVGGIILSQLAMSAYYLWLSPLAGIPGPKIAAMTILYEFYYEAISLGKYTRHIEKMHERWGPIVRISPHEVHIKDPDFCVDAFSSVKKLDKYGWWYRVFGGPGSTISTEKHGVHRIRRSAIQNLLSQRSVRAFSPDIASKLHDVDGIIGEHVRRDDPVNLSSVFRCLAADVVSTYVLPKPLNLLQSDDLGDKFQAGLRFFFEMATVSRYTGFLEPVIGLLPSALLHMFLTSPGKTLLGLVRHLESSVSEVMDLEKSKPDGGRECLMQQLYGNSNLSECDKDWDRMVQEAEQFIVAGSETTGHTLSVTMFHITQDTEVQTRLRQELVDAKISFDTSPDIAELQNLPYLSAVVTEGLRMAHGVGSRLPRINSSSDLQYMQWRIPAGTPVSFTSRLHHEDPRLFPEPRSFRPERWLQPHSKSLKKYLSPFGHGSRICSGMHLALCEMYMTLAYLVLRYNITSYETVEDDIISVNDLGAPFPKSSSKGLQVKLSPIAAE